VKEGRNKYHFDRVRFKNY